jgi:hypothetical protein
MTEIRVATQPTGGVIPARDVPIDHLLITGTTSGVFDQYSQAKYEYRHLALLTNNASLKILGK